MVRRIHTDSLKCEKLQDKGLEQSDLLDALFDGMTTTERSCVGTVTRRYTQ